MTTVEDVARSVLAATDCDANYVLASRWIAERYRQLCSRTRFRHLRRIGELILAAPVTAGTVTTVVGSVAVVGVGTAWSPLLVGRQFRVSAVWYGIANVTDATHLTLTSPYVETAVAASAYRIVQRFTPLPEEVRWLGAFVNMRRRVEIRRAPSAALELNDPERISFNAAGPYVYYEAGMSDGLKLIEFYPYSTQQEVVHFVHWISPELLEPSSPIPNVVDLHVLREGALIDVFRYEMAKAARAGQVDQAALWRNEMRAQSTSWEANIVEAIRADRGVDDVAFVLESARGRTYPGTIRDAHDEVFARGSRP